MTTPPILKTPRSLWELACRRLDQRGVSDVPRRLNREQAHSYMGTVCAVALAVSLAGCAGLPDQRLANEALKRGDTVTAQQNYQQLADLGYSEAQVGLADIQVGTRDPAQIKQAEATYRAAADTSPRAQARLGRLLVAKPGSTEAEHHEAEGLLKKAFANGEGNTLIPLAMLYLQYPHSFPNVNAQQQISQWQAAGYPEAGLAQVLLYRTQGTYDQHLGEVEKICKAALNTTDICYVELATVYQKKAEPEKQAELLKQKVGQIRRAGAHHLQAHGLAELAGAHLRAQRLAQVGHVVFIDVQIGVPRQTELRERLNLAPREQLVEVRPNHAGQQHESLCARLHQMGRQLDDPRQHARDAHDGDVVVAAKGIAPAQAHNEVQRLVGDLREGVRGVQPDRHQQRLHLLAKETRHPLALLGGAVGVVEDEDAGLTQSRGDFFVEDLVLVFDQLVRLLDHLGDVLAVDVTGSGARGLQHIGIAHLKELVEVGRHDADVAQALEQRHIAALGLCQHPTVERQDGLFTTQQLQTCVL